MSSVSIYVITHKETKKHTVSSMYKRLFVGAGLGRNVPAGYLRDDDGEDNISAKNQAFCELTGLYWIWKYSKAEIEGLVHYRRYFFSETCPGIRWHKKIPAALFMIGAGEVKKILKSADIILPEKYSLNEYDVRSHYETFHHIEDLEITRQVIAERHPEFIPAFDEVMTFRKMYHANMMIARKELFDEYAEWLFDVLLEVERRTDTSEYDDYQKRIYGFLSERLLNVFVQHKGLKVETRPVYDPADFLK